MIVVTDPAATAARRAALAAYYEHAVLTSEREFMCSSAAQCIASAVRPTTDFNEGQLPHVGPHYDTTLEGRPWRVLVVGMETREAYYRREPMEQFTARVRDRIHDRNPHMRGVAFALQLAFGLPPSKDRADEFLATQGGPLHVFEAYAMHNATLCAALKLDPRTGRQTSKSAQTDTMRRNCFRHLARAIDILEPTLVISQGADVGQHLGSVFTGLRWHSDTVATARAGDHQFTWVRLAHPSAHGPLRWAWLSPYLYEVVAPSIELARELQG